MLSSFIVTYMYKFSFSNAFYVLDQLHSRVQYQLVITHLLILCFTCLVSCTCVQLQLLIKYLFMCYNSMLACLLSFAQPKAIVCNHMLQFPYLCITYAPFSCPQPLINILKATGLYMCERWKILLTLLIKTLLCSRQPPIMLSNILPPVPPRLVKRVEEGLFIEMFELLPDPLCSADWNSEDQSTSTMHKPSELSIITDWVQSLEFTLQTSHTLLQTTQQT